MLKLDHAAPQFLPLAVRKDGVGNYKHLLSYVDNNTGARFKDLHQFQPDLDTVSSNMLRYDPSIRGSALLQENRGECWQQAFNRWTRVFQVQGAQSCERYGTNTVGLIVGPGALMLITEKHILRVKELLSE